jgi:hypothetical protein
VLTIPYLCIALQHCRPEYLECEQLTALYQAGTAGQMLGYALQFLALLQQPRFYSGNFDRLMTTVRTLVDTLASHAPAAYMAVFDDAVGLLQVVLHFLIRVIMHSASSHYNIT